MSIKARLNELKNDHNTLALIFDSFCFDEKERKERLVRDIMEFCDAVELILEGSKIKSVALLHRKFFNNHKAEMSAVLDIVKCPIKF